MVVAVVGTGTEVGKTWVAARVIESARLRRWTVAARKPVQSNDPGASEPTDAEVLGAASGEPAHQVCPEHRWYPLPMAPPMAAEALGVDAPNLAEIVREIQWPDHAPDLGLVEMVGGVRSPLASDADARDLVREVVPDRVLLVADAGLGTIDSVRLAVDAMLPMETVVFLNRFDASDDLHVRNRDWLTERDRLTVETDIDDLTEVLTASL